MRVLAGFLALACVLVAELATAAELLVKVVDARAGAVADAVVSVAMTDQAPASANRSTQPSTKTIDQKRETFIPYVEVFRPGDSVVFRNSDTTRHHVYSFSPTKSFELVLRPGETSPPIALERVGTVAVGCNIHDQMITYLFVTDAAHAMRSDPGGVARFAGLAPGSYEVRVWHPQARYKPGAAESIRKLEIATDAENMDLEFALSLLPDPRQPQDRERAVY